MARAAEVRAAPASAEAEAWAPQAHAKALALEERAQQLFDAGDSEGAALLAEHAIAAHEHAWVLTRLARAERRRLDAEADLGQQRRTLEDLQAQHQRLAAEAAGLEARAQVARAAQPLPPHEASLPERKESRRRAVASLSAQARLLCVAARLLGEGLRVEPLVRRIDELDRQSESGSAPKQLEAAADLRAECLAVISDVRQKNSSAAARGGSALSAAPAKPPAASPGAAARAPAAETPNGAAPIPADVLLGELSAAGTTPSRDERGVSVSLRGVLGADGKLTGAARTELERLVKVGGAHPEFPVLLVGHGASAPGSPDIERQLQVVSEVLTGAGLSRVETQTVGDRQPLLPASSPAARARNQRIELVFVAPGF
jgi:outer membrane protein OmpA-like peptidoglycan-associated protein